MPSLGWNLLRSIVLLGGPALLVALFVQIGPAQILSLLTAIGANLFVIIAIFAAHESVRALALSRCLAPADRPPLSRLLTIRFLGETVRALTHTGPFLAEPARAWMLARGGLRGPHAYGAAISELIANSTASSLVTVGVLTMAIRIDLLSGAAELMARALIWISLGYSGVVAVALARRIYVIGGILKWLGTLPFVGHRVRADPQWVRQMEDAIMRALRDEKDTVVQVALLELIAQAILVVDLYWALRSMGVSVSLSTSTLIEILTRPANLVQMLGAAEGGYAVVFTWLGMAPAAGFTLSLVKRARSLAVAAAGLALLTRFRGTRSAAVAAPLL